jgi:ADP-dependent NAD(P)H-hydrate dehydratase
LPKILTVSSKVVRDLAVPRIASSKKGDNGTVLVVGGSTIYHGAPLLASMAALRSGTDLVYTAVPRSNIVSVRSASANIIALPLPDGKLTVGSANKILATTPRKPDTAAIGMGMSIAKPEALLALIRGLKRDGIKLLLDASALIPEVLQEISGTSTIVTPHPGEYKRIFGEDAGITEEERISNIDRLSKKHGIIIILKGSTNLVSSCADGRIAVIKRSTSAMTVGGTGDVLSGLTAGLLTKLKPFDASILATYFNGIAADSAYQRVGLHLVATDLIDELPNAMKPFDKIKY